LEDFSNPAAFGMSPYAHQLTLDGTAFKSGKRESTDLACKLGGLATFF